MREPRFRPSEILSLLDHHPTHNLGESTSFDLTYADLLDDATLARLRETPVAYGSSLGLPELRQRIGRNLGIEPDRLILLSGAGLGLFLAGLELVRPGDEALVCTPCFPPSLEGLRAGGGEVRTRSLRFDEGYAVDVGRLLADVTDRTTLVSLASPQNPSGVSVPRASVTDLAEGLAKRNPRAFLIVDETYREAAIEREIEPSVAGLAPNIITAASLSKAHGAPGLRVGWATTHSRELLARLKQGKLNTANTLPIADEIMALAVLDRSDKILGERRALLLDNLERLAIFAEEHAGLIDWIRPDAGALSCARLTERAFDDGAVTRFHRCQSEHDLMVADGRWFHETARVIRIGFGMQRGAEFDEALGALAAALHDAASAVA
ncbi:MAG: pyridoxal phosphate-dependent aminotransferase [Planctomycetota bacterium]